MVTVFKAVWSLLVRLLECKNSWKRWSQMNVCFSGRASCLSLYMRAHKTSMYAYKELVFIWIFCGCYLITATKLLAQFVFEPVKVNKLTTKTQNVPSEILSAIHIVYFFLKFLVWCFMEVQYVTFRTPKDSFFQMCILRVSKKLRNDVSDLNEKFLKIIIVVCL